MSAVKKFERARLLSLIVIFFFSILIFLSFFVRTIYSWNHYMNSFPFETAFRISTMALLAAVFITAIWRYAYSRILSAKDPSLKNMLKDERVQFSWLKAYRIAFFILLAIQFASKWPSLTGRLWEVPQQSLLSLSTALMVGVGAFLFFNRENRHE